MSKFDDVEDAVSKLSQAEKAHLLEVVVRDISTASPGIESNPGVCGGEPCIVRTRIPVWLLEQARRLGASEAELLRLSDVASRGFSQCVELCAEPL